MKNQNSKFKIKKVAVVTGGIRRLGRQITYFLADEGFKLALIYNSSPAKEINKTREELKKKNCEFRFYKCDLRDSNKLKKTISNIKKDFKQIDLLVNNAGVIKKLDFEKITQDDFDNTVNINLRSQLFTSIYCCKYLKKSYNPVIINIASLGGILNWTGYIPYSISKAGVIKLTQLLAKKLSPHIRVNAIAPGTIIIEGEKPGTPEITDAEKIPMKRYGKAEDIIESVKFILNNKYLTGQIINVDGGRSIN